MYIYGETTKGYLIDAFPCFFCKRMLLNCGLQRVVCNTKEGAKIFPVEEWIRDWRENDIIEDAKQYGAGLSEDEVKTINEYLKNHEH